LTEVFMESYLFDLQGRFFENKELKKLKLITNFEETYWELFNLEQILGGKNITIGDINYKKIVLG